MLEEFGFSRREMLAISLAMGGVLLSGSLPPAFAQSAAMRPTSEQGMGPFYPVVKPEDQGADLTTVPGKPGKARGKILHLSGRIFNLEGRPQSDVTVEIWQANAFGRYTHPLDKNPAPLDPNFEGYGTCVTDADGQYGFKTIKPAPYPAEEGWSRPPHIHFQVTTPVTRFVTQMYFPGEPLNEKDRLFRTAGDKESLIVKLTPAGKDFEPGVLIGAWNIVLPRT
jgi:protocatechuate 3,4-dioxygenase beta subunit